jgi:hypothetical protein
LLEAALRAEGRKSNLTIQLRKGGSDIASVTAQFASLFCMTDTDPMALIKAYFDDSGTDLKSAVAVAACYISDVRRWDLFEAEWKSVLSDAGISECGFHMADFVARKPPFDAWEEAKRDYVLKSLVSAIGLHALDGMVTAVIKSDYDRFVTGKLREKLGEYHYTFAVQSCLDFVEKWRGLNSKEPIQFIFDQMGKGRGEINDLFGSLIEHKIAERFGVEPCGWSFQNRRFVVQLQAPDILAWEANKYMKENQFTDKEARKSFESLMKQVQTETRFFDSTTLPDFVADATAKYEATNWGGPLGGFFGNP